MSYNDREGDQQQQQSCELYILTTGATVSRVTSYYTDITVDGETYTHIPVKRSGFTRDITGSIPSVTLEVPILPPFSNYLAETPVEPSTIEIRKYFLYGAHWPNVLMFSGIIRNVSVSKNIARATCVSKEFRLKQKIPRVLVQGYCNNELYDSVCGLDRNNYKATGVLTHIGWGQGETAWLRAPGYVNVSVGDLQHGYVEFGNDKRFIVEHVGDKIWIAGRQFSGISVGQTTYAYAGCQKSPFECKTRFNNLDQFIGFPYVPHASPVRFDSV